MVVKKVNKNPNKGVKRFHWDMRYTPKDPISLRKPSFYNPFSGKRQGSLVSPGTYTVEMAIMDNGSLKQLGEPMSFEVKALNNTVLPAEDREAKVAFQREVAALSADMSKTRRMMTEINNKIRHMKEAIKMAESPMTELNVALIDLENKVREINQMINGDRVKRRLDIDQPPTPFRRVGSINYEQKYSTSAPTQTHKDGLEIAKEEYEPIREMVIDLYTKDVVELEELLESVGAPYTPGRVVNEGN